jgi:adenine-specific DNA-methyltransferase
MPVIHFKGKTAIESYHHTIPHHTLEFDPKLSVLSKREKPSLDGNLIIEGDNLLALKALLPTHAGQIKCIYIDPPYNTGNEGWVYNDNLTQPQFKEWIGKTVGKEGEDFTRHDKWCCMMYPRLQLLKEMLRDDGVIFVSIDDNECRHLRMIMDEIFGEQNFVATIVWQKVYTVKNSAKYLSDMHDFLVLYAKDKPNWKRNLRPRDADTDEDYDNPDDDPNGPWISHALQSRNYYSKGTYKIDCPGGRVIEGPPSGTYWRVSEENFWKADSAKKIWWGKEQNNLPRVKEYLKDVKAGVVPATWWPYQYAGSNSGAKTTLRQIMADADVFVTPKPVELVRRILELASDKDSIILDSFAGSGTTAHAVLAFNKEDGGNRKFVLVQQPFETKEDEKEKINLCQRITAERVRRVINGYGYTTSRGKKEKVEGLGGYFSYSKLGAALFGEYRDLGKKLPDYDELAKYIFYTETSSDFDKKGLNSKTGKIGEYRKTSYYLLYTPNNKGDQALDLKWLKSIEKSEKNRNLVVYCEKIWIHRDDLAKYQKETGRKVRPMLVPFNLK